MSLPLGADGLATTFLDRSTTPEAETERVLGAIDQLDPTLEAWQVVYADEARAAARAATTAIRMGNRVGPFHGVPFALKDIVDLKGRVTTAGSKAWSQRISPATAEIAKRLLAAGGILLVASGMAACAIGTDTGGSVPRPTSITGCSTTIHRRRSMKRAVPVDCRARTKRPTTTWLLINNERWTSLRFSQPLLPSMRC